MNRRGQIIAWVVGILLGVVLPCPAPLIFTPGEGWRYEKAGGGGSWTRGRAKDQLEVAQTAFAEKDYGTTIKAAQRTVRAWPFSDYAPTAQYLLGRAHEAKGDEQKAFQEYQRLLEQYPKGPQYDEVILRQMAIANRFLAGQWFRFLGLVPAYRSMDKTIEMYEKILKSGPFSEVAPQAQINIGLANERRVFPDYPEAARAYERAADKYADRREGTDALYRLGQTYYRQAGTAEYDQSVAGQAIASFTDFITLYPEDARVREARGRIAELKTEQARGNLEIARYYEKRRRWKAARIYYNSVNQVLVDTPDAPYAVEARQRLEALDKAHPDIR
ncbi:MAG: hypothetical protein RJA22_2370 [Verrucomicrobiota bacterium]